MPAKLAIYKQEEARIFKEIAIQEARRVNPRRDVKNNQISNIKTAMYNDLMLPYLNFTVQCTFSDESRGNGFSDAFN